jgi:transposase
VSKVAVLAGVERRRRWTTAEKRRVVEESLTPGTSVIEVARRHDVHPNLLTVWRRQARTGAFGPAPAAGQDDKVQFAAVSIAPEQPAWTSRAGTGGTIEIAFASGVQLRITGAVDPATLTAAVAALSGGRAR